MKKPVLVLALILVMTLPSWGNPLRNLRAGDTVDITRFESAADLSSLKGVKALLLWNNSKRLSSRVYKVFQQVCYDKQISCVAVDLGVGDGGNPEATAPVLNARDPKEITNKWGVFTLPVTVFINEDNTVREIMGYEGQFQRKMENLIDLMRGAMTQEQYAEVDSASAVDRSRSKLPEINFILRLLADGQEEEARKELEKVSRENLSGLEMSRLAQVLLVLGNIDDALAVLANASDTDFSAKFYRGVALFMKGQDDEALALLQSIEKLYPDKKRLAKVLGKIYLKKGDYENAAKMFDNAVGSVLD